MDERPRDRGFREVVADCSGAQRPFEKVSDVEY